MVPVFCHIHTCVACRSFNKDGISSKKLGTALHQAEPRPSTSHLRTPGKVFYQRRSRWTMD
jgi:hypothetical protein